MAISYLILGESGSGKSTSIGNIPELGIKGLDPKETVIINVMDKPLPFRGSGKSYSGSIKEGGNTASVSDSKTIIEILNFINKDRPDIKNIVIDDYQYTMADEFMKRGKEKGYEKFTEIGMNAYNLITHGKSMRDNINFIVLSHSELDEKAGTFKSKTIGKMLDDKVNLAGLFTVVLFADMQFNEKKEPKYSFITNMTEDPYGNRIPAKTPLGMFEELRIPNDLGLVVESAKKYYEE